MRFCHSRCISHGTASTTTSRSLRARAHTHTHMFLHASVCVPPAISNLPKQTEKKESTAHSLPLHLPPVLAYASFFFCSFASHFQQPLVTTSETEEMKRKRKKEAGGRGERWVGGPPPHLTSQSHPRSPPRRVRRLCLQNYRDPGGPGGPALSPPLSTLSLQHA